MGFEPRKVWGMQNYYLKKMLYQCEFYIIFTLSTCKGSTCRAGDHRSSEGAFTERIDCIEIQALCCISKLFIGKNRARTWRLIQSKWLEWTRLRLWIRDVGRHNLIQVVLRAIPVTRMPMRCSKICKAIPTWIPCFCHGIWCIKIGRASCRERVFALV